MQTTFSVAKLKINPLTTTINNDIQLIYDPTTVDDKRRIEA